MSLTKNNTSRKQSVPPKFSSTKNLSPFALLRKIIDLIAFYFPLGYVAVAFLVFCTCWVSCSIGIQEMHMMMIGFLLNHILFYWIPALSFLYMDLYRPDLVARWKIFNNPPIPLPPVQKMIGVVFRNHLVFIPSLVIICYYALQYRSVRETNHLSSYGVVSSYLGSSNFFSWSTESCSDDSLSLAFVSVLAYGLTFDIFHFLGHYFLHIDRSIYVAYHALHHSTYATCGMTGHYMGFLDFMFETIIPSAGCFLVYIYGASTSAIMVFLSIGLLNGVISHSGYQLPGFPSPATHYLHHKKYMVNYGIDVIMDKSFNTYESGDLWLQYQKKSKKKLEKKST